MSNGSDLLNFRFVGESDESRSSAIGKEGVINKSLDLGFVVPFCSLSCLVNSFEESSDLVLCVFSLKESFSVIWVIASVEGVVNTIVDNWNTSSGKNESNSGFQSSLIIGNMKEPRSVVAFNKVTKNILILEISVHILEVGFPVIHRLALSEDFLQLVVEIVVEKRIHVVLVLADVSVFIVGDFTD